MNEPQQLRGLKVDSGGSIFEAREEGACGEETLEMWERLANSYKESTEEEGCRAGGEKRVFLGKGAFFFFRCGTKGRVLERKYFEEKNEP